MAADDTGAFAAHKIIGQIQNARNGQAVTLKGYIGFHDNTSIGSRML